MINAKEFSMLCRFVALVLLPLVGTVFAANRLPAAPAGTDANARAQRFIGDYEAVIRPMEIEVSRRWWDANVSGKEDDYRLKEEAETRLDVRLADPKAFADLKAIRAAKPSDPLLARQIEVLYLEYLSRQVDPDLLKQMNAKANAVERAFNTYRPHLQAACLRTTRCAA